MKRIRTVAGMATFPGRNSTLHSVLKSIAHQVDTIYLYLNQLDHVPDFLAHFPNVRPILGKESLGDISATGKLYFLRHESEGIGFTLDDDIIYPCDYVASMVRNYDELGGGLGLCVHGSVIPDIASWYYERTVLFDSETDLSSHVPVNLIGSGTFCFGLNDIRLVFEDFMGAVQVDLGLSRAFLRAGLPLAAIARDAGWLKFLDYPGMTRKFKSAVTHHTLGLRDAPELRLANLGDVWRQFVDQRPGIAGLTEIEAFLNELGSSGDDGHVATMPTNFLTTPYCMAKALRFSRMWAR